MTCIVGIAFDGRVMLGADSADVAPPFNFVEIGGESTNG